MSDGGKTYENDAIRVFWEPKRCIHSGLCIHGQPAVFDATRRPWVDVNAADAAATGDVIRRCPTGALRYERLDGGPGEPVPPENTALVSRHGPIYLRGDLKLVGEFGAVVAEGTRMALCRCGLSANKPFCDGAHGRAGFADRAEAPAEAQRPDEPMGGELRIEATVNGPLAFRGPCILVDSAGRKAAYARQFMLCRCGHSAAKPFCDGSHTARGFVDG